MSDHILLLDPIRWMVLGMAIANKHFAALLFEEVGRRAFEDGSVAEEVFGLIEVMSADGFDWRECGHAMETMMALLGDEFFDPKEEKISTAFLRILAKESEDSWEISNDKHHMREMKELAKRIRNDTAKMVEKMRVRKRPKPKKIDANANGNGKH